MIVLASAATLASAVWDALLRRDGGGEGDGGGVGEDEGGRLTKHLPQLTWQLLSYGSFLHLKTNSAFFRSTSANPLPTPSALAHQIGCSSTHGGGGGGGRLGDGGDGGGDGGDGGGGEGGMGQYPQLPSHFKKNFNVLHLTYFT